MPTVSDSRHAVEVAEKLEREREVALEHRNLLRNKKKERNSEKFEAAVLNAQLAAEQQADAV
jgi:hypothetical protein